MSDEESDVACATLGLKGWDVTEDGEAGQLPTRVSGWGCPPHWLCTLKAAHGTHSTFHISERPSSTPVFPVEGSAVPALLLATCRLLPPRPCLPLDVFQLLPFLEQLRRCTSSQSRERMFVWSSRAQFSSNPPSPRQSEFCFPS